jgi:TM2 domain-containing membrane protein YozV
MSDHTINVSGAVTVYPVDERSDRGALGAMLLCMLLGVFGAHRLYLGKYISGGIMLLLTLSFTGLLVTVPWAILDFFVLLLGAGTDGYGRRLRFWG